MDNLYHCMELSCGYKCTNKWHEVAFLGLIIIAPFIVIIMMGYKYISLNSKH